ncbi:hypothetical protein T06_14133 [Trichinella sp. T6]|nr:hypothetical protein T06_14133 [Trichinella sp. T6]
MSILYIIFSIRGNVSPKLHSNVSWQYETLKALRQAKIVNITDEKLIIFLVVFIRLRNNTFVNNLINTQYCYERFKIAAMKNPISNDFQLLFCNGKEKEPPTAS